MELVEKTVEFGVELREFLLDLDCPFGGLYCHYGTLELQWLVVSGQWLVVSGRWRAATIVAGTGWCLAEPGCGALGIGGDLFELRCLRSFSGSLLMSLSLRHFLRSCTFVLVM